VGFRHELKNEIDAQKGVPTKNRIHSPVVIQKNLDYATPELHKSQKEKRVFPSFELKFYHRPRSGNETHYFTLTLTNAKIASIKLVMPDAALAANSNVHEYEEIEFTYESIAWGSAPAPTEGLEAGSYTPHNSTDILARFAPDWLEEQAKSYVRKMYEAVKEAAQKKFEEDLKKAKQPK
jgi:type VI secretion system Hcp family effector